MGSSRWTNSPGTGNGESSPTTVVVPPAPSLAPNALLYWLVPGGRRKVTPSSTTAPEPGTPTVRDGAARCTGPSGGSSVQEVAARRTSGMQHAARWRDGRTNDRWRSMAHAPGLGRGRDALDPAGGRPRAASRAGG